MTFDAWIILAFSLVWSSVLSIIAIECKRELVRGVRRWRVNEEIQRMLREEFSELR